MIMIRLLTFSLICLLLSGNGLAQKEVVTVEGEAQVEWPDTKSRKQVEQESRDNALINALESAFGRAVIEGNSTYVKNLNSGNTTSTSTVFNMIANTHVKGEVIEILDESFEEIKGIATINKKKREIRDLKCNIRIKARELSETMPDFTAFPLSCTDRNCYRTEFKNDESLFLYFKSPSPGYLSVFLDDGKVAQCLLPYPRMSHEMMNGLPVKANQDYILFSRLTDQNYFGEKNATEEYQLVAESPHDQNRLFILYSATPIESPTLVDNMNNQILTEFEKDQGYRVPRAMKSEEFQNWLIKSRIRKNDLGVKIIDITITR